MRCVQRRACPRPLNLNLLPPPTPLINYTDVMAMSEPSSQDAFKGIERCAILIQDDFMTPPC